MAFADSEVKRRSIRKGGRGGGKRIAPIPDGAIDSSEDRAHMASLYRGAAFVIPRSRSCGLLLRVYR